MDEVAELAFKEEPFVEKIGNLEIDKVEEGKEEKGGEKKKVIEMFVSGWAEGLKRKKGKKICLVHICIYNYISFDLLLSFILPFILLYSDFPFLRFTLFAPSIFRAIKLWWITRKVLITTKIEKFIYADYAPEWRKIFSKENCNL